ncbi:MAG: DUF4160 domain-containing protein [Pirellulales bacterium]
MSETMPVISRFYGITIRMFYNDHAPPHFHAVYGEHELAVGIDPVMVLSGNAPKRVQTMVSEWAELRQAELLDNWYRGRRTDPFSPVDPLP